MVKIKMRYDGTECGTMVVPIHRYCHIMIKLQHQKSQLESVSLYEDSNWLYYIYHTLVRIASITASPTRAKLARR